MKPHRHDCGFDHAGRQPLANPTRSLPFTGSALNAMARGVAELVQWTGAGTPTLVDDCRDDPLTAHALFDSVNGLPNIAAVAFTPTAMCLEGSTSLLVTTKRTDFSDPLRLLVRVARALRDAAAVWRCPEPTGRSVCAVLPRRREGVVSPIQCERPGPVSLGNVHAPTSCVRLSLAFLGSDDSTLTGKKNCAKHCCCTFVAVHFTRLCPQSHKQPHKSQHPSQGRCCCDVTPREAPTTPVSEGGPPATDGWRERPRPRPTHTQTDE